MGQLNLSSGTELRISLLFRGDEREQVRQIISSQCGNNLPFLQKLNEFQLERFRFAVLKLSEGDINKLHSAVKLAKEDWRDLLVAAGFADDIHAHNEWMPDER